MTTSVVASRVTDTSKTITSRSGVNRAEKTRETLATAAAILRMSTSDKIANEVAATQIDRQIDAINVEIIRYYRNR